MPGNELPDDPLRFDEFPAAGYDDWLAAALASIDGKPFEKLQTATYEGITLQPLYRREDTAGLSFVAGLPGQPPFVRGASAVARPWLIAQPIYGATPAAWNIALRAAVAGGQTVVVIGPDSPPRHTVDDLAAALAGVDLMALELHIHPGAEPLPLLALLVAAAGRLGVAPAALRGWIAYDPTATLAEAGELPVSLAAAYDDMALLTRWAMRHAPDLRTIAVNTAPWHEAGANAVQELAIALAGGAAALRELTQRGLDIDTISSRMAFGFAVGGQFFMEIAKLRAARLLWSQVVEAFGGGPAAAAMEIHALPTRRNKTATDPHTNMLRATTEGLAAAAGGARSLGLLPYDALLHAPDDFSARIARNVQIILQEEVNLTRLLDPAGGSWAVETLTDRLAHAAWALFQDIEREGGLADALQTGFIQSAIGEVATKRLAAAAKRRDVIVGVNQYAAWTELPRPAPDLTRHSTGDDAAVEPALLRAIAAAYSVERVDAAVIAAGQGATTDQLAAALRLSGDLPADVEPLRPMRPAAPYERLRARAAAYAAAHGSRPRVFLANLGPPRQHKARADFSQGFFEAGGFEVVGSTAGGNNGFGTPEEAAAAALASGAPAVVVCSTDETYPELVPPLVQQIRAAAPGVVVVLAGRPVEQVEMLAAAGVDGFIYLGADAVAMNEWLMERVGR